MAAALTADQDPLATLVLPSLTKSAPRGEEGAAACRTPGPGSTRAGGKPKESKQVSLLGLGFFSKTPAAARAAAPSARTPTTGGF